MNIQYHFSVLVLSVVLERSDLGFYNTIGPAVGHSVECVQMLCAADREKGIVAKLAQS